MPEDEGFVIWNQISKKYCNFGEIAIHKKTGQFKIVWSISGASNLRPRNIFVRPKLDSEFKEKSVFWPIFLRFLIGCSPNYEKKADLRPKYQLGLDASGLFWIEVVFKKCDENLWYFKKVFQLVTIQAFFEKVFKSNLKSRYN
jgi:hypothetical protein